MARVSITTLEKALRQAGTQVVRGGRYRHYKDVNSEHLYEVLDSVIIEATEGVGVLYRSLHHPEVTFVRPLQEFLERIETQEGSVPRFTHVS